MNFFFNIFLTKSIICLVYTTIHNYIRSIINNNPKYLLILIILITTNKILFSFMFLALNIQKYNFCIFIIIAGITAVSVAYARYAYFYVKINKAKPPLLIIFFIGCLLFIIIKFICLYFSIPELIMHLLQSTILFIDLGEFILIPGPFERLFNSGASSHRFNTAGSPGSGPGPGGDPGNLIGSFGGTMHQEIQRPRSTDLQSQSRRRLPLANPLLIDNSLPLAIKSDTYNTYTVEESFNPYTTDSTKNFRKSVKLAIYSAPSEGASPEEYAYFKKSTYLIQEGVHRCKTICVEANDLLNFYNYYYDRAELLRNNINATLEFNDTIEKRNDMLGRLMYINDLMDDNADLGHALHEITNTQFSDYELSQNYLKLSNFWIKDIKDAAKYREIYNKRDVR